MELSTADRNKLSDHIGLSRDAGDEKFNHCAELYYQLQETISEQAASIESLIKDTVTMHRQMREEMSRIMEQDKEEDAIVRESVIRTELAEKEMQRNPQYTAFASHRGTSNESSTEQLLSDWAAIPALVRHAAWEAHVRFDVDEVVQLTEGIRARCEKETAYAAAALWSRAGEVVENFSKPVFAKTGGVPLFDLDGTEETRRHLGLAVDILGMVRDGEGPELSDNDLARAHLVLLAVLARAPADGEGLARSKVLKDHLMDARLHRKPLYITFSSFASLPSQRSLRCFIIRKRLVAIEQRHPHVYYPDRSVGALAAAERFVKEVLLPCQEFSVPNYVADVVVIGGDDVRIEWIHAMSFDAAQSFSWEDVCNFSAEPAGTKAVHSKVADRPPTIADFGRDTTVGKVWLHLLVGERQNLVKGSGCWQGKGLSHEMWSALTAKEELRKRTSGPSIAGCGTMMAVVGVMAAAFFAGRTTVR